MWITVDEFGRKYVFECLKRFLNGNSFLIALFVLYAGSVIFLLIKGNKKERVIFVYPAFAWLLTVFNPWVAEKFIPIFSLNARYYRFFWILPIAVLPIYMLVKVLEKCDKKGKAVILAGCVLICAVCHSQLMPWPEVTDNIYRVSGEVIKAADIVAADKKKDHVNAVYDGMFFYNIRQYDASFESFVNEKEFEEIYSSSVTQENMDAVIETGDYHELLKNIYFYDLEIDADLMRKALLAEEIDYIFVPNPKAELRARLYECGCCFVGETENYSILRMD